jgi:hypothetical protein
LEKIERDMKATWSKLDQILDQIEDPEIGLARIADRPSGETPEQTYDFLFWQIQFTEQRNWLQGDAVAIWRAGASCHLSRKSPPAWLCKAIGELCMRYMSADDKRAYRKMQEHFLRWETVESVRRQTLKDPRKKKNRDNDVWEKAAKLIPNTDAKPSGETVRKSHQLIKRAGGSQVTFQSYKRAAKERYLPRKKQRKKS